MFTASTSTKEKTENGMLTSVRLLNDLISAEVEAGIDSSRVVVGGFSQGGALSLLTGLTPETKLGRRRRSQRLATAAPKI